MTDNHPSPTAGGFRRGEILTLTSGDAWRVDALIVNVEGRHGVSLVDPFDSNHETRAIFATPGAAAGGAR